jgi:hypothetical protein
VATLPINATQAYISGLKVSNALGIDFSKERINLR